MSSAISGLSSNSLTRSGESPNAFAELSSEEFVKIMVEELTSQDPLSPNDSAAVLEQISSISQIESQNTLEDSLLQMVEQNSVAQATSLLGQRVEGLNNSNNEVAGTVVGIRLIDGQPVLKLSDGSDLPFGRVTAMDFSASTDALVTQQLLSNLALLDSSMLVGKYVKGKDAGGVATEGLVTEVVFKNDGGIGLELDNGRQVPIGSVTAFGNAPDA